MEDVSDRGSWGMGTLYHGLNFCANLKSIRNIKFIKNF